jgi:hypothetical protein
MPRIHEKPNLATDTPSKTLTTNPEIIAFFIGSELHTPAKPKLR